MQRTVRIHNNNTVVMGKFFMSSGLIAILNEPLALGVRRAIAGRPLHVPFVTSTVQQVQSRRLCGSSRLLPTYLTYMGSVFSQGGL